MEKLNKVRVFVGSFIVLFCCLVYILLKFRPKTEIPFWSLYDPILIIILGILLKKLISLIVKRRIEKKGLSKFHLFLFYLDNLKNNYLSRIEQIFINKFPKIFLYLSRICHRYVLWEHRLNKSSNLFKRFFGNFVLRGFSVYIIYIAMFFDILNQTWFYIFWGLVFSYFFHLIFGKLIYHWGKLYVLLWVKKNRPQDIESLIELFSKK
jgi:hypothetical protein